MLSYGFLDSIVRHENSDLHKEAISREEDAKSLQEQGGMEAFAKKALSQNQKILITHMKPLYW